MFEERRCKIFLILFQTVLSVLLICSKLYSINPDREYAKTPMDYNLEFEPVNFITTDNYKLFGWFLPSEQDSPKATIICSMLDGGNMSLAIPMVKHFVHSKFNVLLYDYRGFGKSQDFEINKDMLIYPEFLKDLNSAVDFIKSKNNDKIILLGFSMGATISIGVASQRKDITVVIADGAYTSTDEVVNLLNQKYKKENKERRVKNPDNYPSSAQPINAVAAFANTGLCLLAGSLDEITTPKMAQEIFLKCINLNKTIWIAANATHCRIQEHYWTLYFDFIESFINQSLK